MIVPLVVMGPPGGALDSSVGLRDAFSGGCLNALASPDGSLLYAAGCSGGGGGGALRAAQRSATGAPVNTSSPLLLGGDGNVTGLAVWNYTLYAVAAGLPSGARPLGGCGVARVGEGRWQFTSF